MAVGIRDVKRAAMNVTADSTVLIKAKRGTYEKRITVAVLAELIKSYPV